MSLPSSPSSPIAPSDKKSPAGRSSLFIGSTAKAFQVLHVFDGYRKHLTIAEIARLSGLDRSATQRVVHTLETLGYLARVEHTHFFALTSKVLQFSYNYLRANSLIEKAMPYLLDLSRTLGETINLHELDGHEIVFVARFPGSHLVSLDIVVGSRLPAYFTASGTVILSRLPLVRREALLARTDLAPITPHTETSPDILRQRVQQASDQGYALVANETVMGDISIAAPITNDQGEAVAAVNISVPTSRWTLEDVERKLAQHVQVAATSISRVKFARYTGG